MGNGQSMPILSLGHYTIFSYTQPSVALHLTNLMSIIKFSDDDNVLFELHVQKCFIKSLASNQVLLECVLLECAIGLDCLYKFKPFNFQAFVSYWFY